MRLPVRVSASIARHAAGFAQRRSGMPHRLPMTIGVILLATYLLHPTGAQAQPVAPAPASKIDERAVWSQDADLSACQGLPEGQSGPCLEAAMRKSGASAEAIAFAKTLNFDGYLSELNHAGRVDVGTVTYPFRANTNDEAVLLNGIPPLIQVGNEVGTVDMSRNATYAAIAKRFRDNYPHVPVFDSMRFAKGGG
jgi:hypothetical protein